MSHHVPPDFSSLWDRPNQKRLERPGFDQDGTPREANQWQLDQQMFISKLDEIGLISSMKTAILGWTFDVTHAFPDVSGIL